MALPSTAFYLRVWTIQPCWQQWGKRYKRSPRKCLMTHSLMTSLSRNETLRRPSTNQKNFRSYKWDSHWSHWKITYKSPWTKGRDWQREDWSNIKRNYLVYKWCQKLGVAASTLLNTTTMAPWPTCNALSMTLAVALSCTRIRVAFWRQTNN